MIGGHIAHSSEAGPIRPTATTESGTVKGLEGMIEFVPGYQRRTRRAGMPPRLGAEGRAEGADKVLLPAGPAIEAAFEPETLYDAASLVPVMGLESVLGNDDRTLVTPTRESPWRAICALRIKTNRGEKLVGTGWLIDPRTVVTAGHCVFSHDLGGWVSSVEVIPGLDGEERPLGSQVGKRLRAVDGWIKDRSPEYDYGVILLDEPVEIRTDFFMPMALPDAELDGILVNIAGYPADREQARRMYFHARRARDIGTRRMQYDVDTFGGQSGSPVWVTQPDRRRVVAAIHTNGISPGIVFNSGMRITAEVLCNLRQWSAEAASGARTEVMPRVEMGSGAAPARQPGTASEPGEDVASEGRTGTGASPRVDVPPERRAEEPPAAPRAESPAPSGAQPGPARSRLITVEGPTLRLTGKVVDSAGRPVSGASVAISAGSVPYPEIAATSGEDGSFALPITLPGRYEVTAYPSEDSDAGGVKVVPDAPGSAASGSPRRS